MTGSCQGCLTHSTKKDMFLVVFGVFIASSLVAGVIGWDVNRSADSGALSPLETNILDLSTTWCQSVTMESLSTSSRLFVYADEPPLDAHIESSIEDSTTLEPGGYKYVEWNLKQGSYINLTACCEKALSFFIFEGNKFNDWASNGYSPDAGSAGASVVFHYPGGCPELQDENFFQYVIETSDNYYFVFANYNTSFSASVNWTLFADRLEYNVNSSTTQLRCSCTASPSCSCPLHYTKSNTIVVEAGWADEWHDVNLSWNCAPRLWINIIVFTVVGLTPPALTALCMWWCWSGIVKQNRGDNESDIKAIGLLERASSESDEEYEKKRY